MVCVDSALAPTLTGERDTAKRRDMVRKSSFRGARELNFFCERFIYNEVQIIIILMR